MENLEGEIWKPVTGYENYIQVSTTGRVRSLRTQRLVGSVNSIGYNEVKLKINRVTYALLIHRLVAETFIGPIPKWHRVHYRNGQRGDNKITNLQICSTSEHSALHNLVGEGHPRSTLTEETVREIYRRVSVGESETSVAKSLGIRQNRISDIIRARIWKSLGLRPILPLPIQKDVP